MILPVDRANVDRISRALGPPADRCYVLPGKVTVKDGAVCGSLLDATGVVPLTVILRDERTRDGPTERRYPRRYPLRPASI